jgi:hypothetical protein
MLWLSQVFVSTQRSIDVGDTQGVSSAKMAEMTDRISNINEVVVRANLGHYMFQGTYFS